MNYELIGHKLVKDKEGTVLYHIILRYKYPSSPWQFIRKFFGFTFDTSFMDEEYIGSGTVWHSYPYHISCGTDMCSTLYDIWTGLKSGVIQDVEEP